MKTIEQLVKEFKENTCAETYKPLFNMGVYMWTWVSTKNRWERITRYKSDFSDIFVGCITYSDLGITPNGVWCIRK